MNDYKELISTLRTHAEYCDMPFSWMNDSYEEAANAIEQLVKEGEYIPTDTLRKYHAWLLEEYHKNPTSENLHSINMAISWLKAYADYKCINVDFCD